MSILVEHSPKFSIRVWISFKVCCLRIIIQFSDTWIYIEHRWIWTKYTRLWPIWMWPTKDLLRLDAFYDLHMLKHVYFVAIAGTVQWSLIPARWSIADNYIPTPNNNCDHKFKGSGHKFQFVFLRLVRTCYSATVALFRPRRRGRRSQNLVPRG